MTIVSSIGKILVSSSIGSNMFKMLILTVFQETQVTCSWSMCSKICKKNSGIGKILYLSRIGGNVQDVDLDCFHGSKYALRCYLFIWSKKKARFEGEEKLVEKSRNLVEKSRKLVEKIRKLVEKSRAS